MATNNGSRTRRGAISLLLATALFAAIAGCASESKDQPPMEKTATPPPMTDKSGKPMQGPPPGMPR